MNCTREGLFSFIHVSRHISYDQTRTAVGRPDLVRSPRFIPKSMTLGPRFIPRSVFYTQSVVRSPCFILTL